MLMITKMIIPNLKTKIILLSNLLHVYTFLQAVENYIFIHKYIS